MRGSGLSFSVADGTGKWVDFHRDRVRVEDYGDPAGHESGWSSTDVDIDESGTNGSRRGARLRPVEEEGEIV
jgi:hypothetical protein